MTRVNSGADHQAKAMGGDTTVAQSGTATSAPAATTLTDTASTWPASTTGPPDTGGAVGHILISGNVGGVILKNTATVFTIDYWHQLSNWGSTTAGTTPSNGATYVVCPGQAPAMFMGLSVATRTIAAADAFLTNDGTTVSELWGSGGGLNRAICAFTHSLGVGSYTLTITYTSNTNDNGNAAATVHRIGVFPTNVTAAPTTATTGEMLFETNLSNDAVLVPSQGDKVTVTESVTI